VSQKNKRKFIRKQKRKENKKKIDKYDKTGRWGGRREEETKEAKGRKN
jgi:hypothetical protein